jgi:hypothetical protein
MRPYAVYLHERVLVQTPRSGTARERIMTFVRQLANDPHRQGDYRTRDEVGHDLEVTIVGNYAVTFWTDHAVCEVKVLNVQPADKV